MITRRSFLSLAGASALASLPRHSSAAAKAGSTQTTPSIDAARLRNRLERLSYPRPRPRRHVCRRRQSRRLFGRRSHRARVDHRRDQVRRHRAAHRRGRQHLRAVRRAAESAADPVRIAHRLGADRRQLRRRPRVVLGARSDPGGAGGEDPDAPSARDGGVGARGEHGVRHRHRGQPHRRRRPAGRRHGQGVERHEARRRDQEDCRQSRSDRNRGSRQGRVALVRRAAHRTGRHARQGQGSDRHRRRHRRDSSLRRRHRGHGQSRRHDADERAARRDGGGRAS